MRTAPTITIDPTEGPGIADEETIFNGLLLAVIGRRRLLVLIGDSPGARVGLLARLARHLEADGSMVMTVAAATGVTVEDLIEVAGSSMLGPDQTPAEFESLVEALEDQLDQSGAGVMMVEEADRLSPDTLRDLVELSGSVTSSGRFLQVLLSGGPDLRRRLEVTDLLPTLEAVGTIYSMAPTGPMDAPGAEVEAPVFTAGRSPHRDQPSRKGRWLALAMIAVLAGAGGLYLHESGLLDQQRVAETLGLEEMLGDPRRAPAPDTSLAEAPADSRVATRPADLPPVLPASPTAPRAGQTAPPAAAEPDPAPLEDAPRYSPEETARLNELAARGLAEEPVAAAPPARPDEEPPAEESQPLDDGEIQALDTAEEQADARIARNGPTAAPAEDDVAMAPPPPPPADQRQLRGLIATAEAQFAARKLTTPQDDNAFTTMQEIRAIDPEHPALTDLKARILETYRTWASTAESRQDWQTARVYYQRALRVDPTNAEMTARLDAVDDRLSQRPAAAPRRQQQQNNAPPEPRLRP